MYIKKPETKFRVLSPVGIIYLYTIDVPLPPWDKQTTPPPSLNYKAVVPTSLEDYFKKVHFWVEKRH